MMQVHATRPNLNILWRKSFWQKVLACSLIALGVSLTIVAVLVPGVEFLLGISVPILVAGISVTADILDPRSRFIANTINYRGNNTTRNNQTSYNSSVIAKMQRALSRYGIRVSPPSSDHSDPNNDFVVNDMANDADNLNFDVTALPATFDQPAVITFSPQALRFNYSREALSNSGDTPTNINTAPPRRAVSDSAIYIS